MYKIKYCVFMISIKKWTISFLESIYTKVFKREMSDNVRTFLKNLSLSIFGGGIASAAMMVINIGAGRMLGPSGYGEYGLVLAISQIFMVPIVLGLDVSGVRAISSVESRREKSLNISSVFHFVGLSSIVFIFLYLVFNNFVSKILNIDRTILLMSAIYAIVTSFKVISDSFVRALLLFKTQLFARLVEMITIIFLFSLFFLVIEKQNYTNYLISILGGSIVFCIILLAKYLPYLTKFDFSYLKKQLSYSSVLLFGSILGAIYNVLEKMVIARYLSVFDLGIYLAYFTASLGMIAQLTQMFVNVFFPSITKSSNRSVYLKVEKIFLSLFFPTLLLISCLIFIIINFFGKTYGMNYYYVFGFGLLATMQMLLGINYYIFASSSKKLYFTYVKYVGAINFLQLLAYGAMIYFDIVSIDLIIVVSMVNSIANITFQRKLIMNKDIMI